MDSARKFLKQKDSDSLPCSFRGGFVDFLCQKLSFDPSPICGPRGALPFAVSSVDVPAETTGPLSAVLRSPSGNPFIELPAGFFFFHFDAT
jgi:hypothetical protein